MAKRCKCGTHSEYVHCHECGRQLGEFCCYGGCKKMQTSGPYCDYHEEIDIAGRGNR